MGKVHGIPVLLRQVAPLVLLGFLTVVLAGPMLALIAVLGALALLGFLLGGPGRIFVLVKRLAWMSLTDVAKALGRGLTAAGKLLALVMFGLLHRLCRVLWNSARFLLKHVYRPRVILSDW